MLDPLPSITSVADWATPIAPPAACPAKHPQSDFDVTYTSERLLDNIQYLSNEAQFVRDHAGLDNLESVVAETSQIGKSVLTHFRGQAHDLAQELGDMREVLNAVDRMWNNVSQAAEQHLRARGNHTVACLLAHKRSPRGSEDSQLTAVEPEPTEIKILPKTKETKKKTYHDVGVITDALPFKAIETTAPNGARAVPWPEWLDSFILSADSSTYKMHLANLIEIERELLAKDAMSSFEEKISSKEPVLKSLLRSRKRYEKVERSGASKLKAWLKKKVVADKPLQLQLCYDLDDPDCAVGREVKGSPVSFPSLAHSQSEHEAYSIHFNLSVAGRDLSTIDECLRGVRLFILACK